MTDSILVRRELTPDEANRVRAILDGTDTPAVARPASTVALIRDGKQGLEVHLIRRAASMVFGGAYVFPGGSIEHQDAARVDWVGPEPSWWARRFEVDQDRAVEVVNAGVREVFEETGVVLGRPRADRAPQLDTADSGWESSRRQVESGERELGDVFTERQVVAVVDRMVPVQHWITPIAGPRRFDTYFLVAALPSGQQPRDVGGEAEEHAWVRPGDVLDDGRAIMAPTRALLTDLASHASVDAALAADRQITTVLPPVHLDGSTLVVMHH